MAIRAPRLENAPLRSAVEPTRSAGPRLARRCSQALLLLILGLSAACDSDSEGGSEAAATPSSPVAAATTIDLPPGQTSATLGWAPSDGIVDSYFVYISRNDAAFEPLAPVATPRVTIQGSAGDSVQIVVLAINSTGLTSEASPPSPKLVFHGEEGSVAAATTLEREDAAVVVASTADLSQTQTTEVSNDSTTSTDLASTSPEATDPTNATDATDATDSETRPAEMSLSTRELLVRADARFPVTALSDSADHWIQTRVEEQFSAGVRLVGTGERNRDALRELVWQDHSGQLFVSDGQAVVDSARTADVPLTFEEGIRLRSAERFVALADFDANGIGDWLIEDGATGELWILSGDSLEVTNARSAREGLDWELVGTGDFDGDGRTELVWQQPDGILRFGHPSAQVPLEDVLFPIEANSRFLTVADLDGDGRDDLLTVDLEGRLHSTRVVTVGTRLGLESRPGPLLPSDGLEMLVTLDVDEDGRAEIAWLNAGELEIWDPESGPQHD